MYNIGLSPSSLSLNKPTVAGLFSSFGLMGFLEGSLHVCRDAIVAARFAYGGNPRCRSKTPQRRICSSYLWPERRTKEDDEKVCSAELKMRFDHQIPK